MLAASPLLVQVQGAIEGVHAVSGLPWFGTIAACAIGVRLATLPLVVAQTRNTAKLFGLPAVVRLSAMFQQESAALREKKTSSSQESAALFLKYIRGMRSTWKLHGLSPALSFIVPAVQIPALITFTFAARGLMYSEEHLPALREGGALWFTDLAAADPFFILPTIAIATTYLSIDMSFSSKGPMVFRLIGEVLQTVLIVSMPVVLNLPAGVFMYWIPASMFGICQTLAMRQPEVMQLILGKHFKRRKMPPPS